MEIVKTTTIGKKPRKPRMYHDKTPALLSLMTRTLKNMYTPARLQELIEELSPRDQAMLFIAYVKPPPADKAKDEFDKLSDEQLEKLAAMVSNEAKRVMR